MFWGLHDWLFANQATWSNAQDAAAQFRKQAVALGVDGAEYDACLTNPATEARISRDIQDGTQLGVEGTPSVFVNDWYKFGSSLEDIEQMIDKAQRGIHPSPTATPLPTGKLFYDADLDRAGRTYDGSPMLGSADAPLLLIQFEDLKSADAAKYAADTEPQLIEKYITPGKLRVVYKMFPTDGPKAAAAGVCAAEQGKFWEFRALLLTKQAEWTDGDNAKMTEYAKSLGLDEAKFTACQADVATQYEVESATQFGQDVGVPSVPAFLILDLSLGQAVNNILGAQPFSEFDAKLQAALTTPTPEAPAATPTPAPTK